MKTRNKSIASLGDPTDQAYLSTGSIRQVAQISPGVALTVLLTIGYKQVTGDDIDPMIPIAVLALLSYAGTAGMRLIEKIKGRRIL